MRNIAGVRYSEIVENAMCAVLGFMGIRAEAPNCCCEGIDRLLDIAPQPRYTLITWRFHMRQIAPDNKRFPWGTIVAIHEIGDIQIVEHDPKIASVGRFCPYVGGKDVQMSANSLDGALALALAFKYNDVDAGFYICKLLGITKDLE